MEGGRKERCTLQKPFRQEHTQRTAERLGPQLLTQVTDSLREGEGGGQEMK